jgi:small subunit ribosomal protein S21
VDLARISFLLKHFPGIPAFTAWRLRYFSSTVSNPGGHHITVLIGTRGQKPYKEPRLQIIVRDNNIDQALKALKKKMQREGIFREMKLRGHYEKPSEKRARERAEAIRRYRKLQRKRLQREGLLPK